MQQNVGVLESVLRVGAGFALMFVAFIIAPPLKYAAWAGCLILVVSGFVGKCPIWRAIGLSTCRAQAIGRYNEG